MQCSQVRKMLINYALGDTRVTERLCVDVHIVHCRACRAELEDAVEFVLACDRALSHPKPIDDFDAVMSRIHADESAAKDRPIVVRWNWNGFAVRTAAVAAIVLLVIFSAPLVKQTGRAVDRLRDAAVEPAETRSPAQVPVVTRQFVKRAQSINDGEIAAVSPAADILSAVPLP